MNHTAFSLTNFRAAEMTGNIVQENAIFTSFDTRKPRMQLCCILCYLVTQRQSINVTFLWSVMKPITTPSEAPALIFQGTIKLRIFTKNIKSSSSAHNIQLSHYKTRPKSNIKPYHRTAQPKIPNRILISTHQKSRYNHANQRRTYRQILQSSNFLSVQTHNQ